MNQASYGKALIKRLSALVITIGASQMIILSQISLISEYCGLSVAELGMLVAIGTACIMFAGPYWGQRIDRLGAKPVLRFGLITSLLANVVFVGVILLLGLQRLDPSLGFAILICSRIVNGIGAAGIYPSCQSWGVNHTPPEQRMKVLSSLSAAVNIGRVIGPLLALPTLALLSLLKQFPPSLQLTTLLWILILPLFGLWALGGLQGQAVNTDDSNESTAKEPFAVTPYLLFFLAACCTITVSQLQVLLGPVLEDFYHLSALAASKGSAALLVAIAVVAATIQLTVVRRIRSARFGLILGGSLLTVGLICMQALLGGWGALPGLLLIVAGITLMIPAYTSLISASAGTKQGRIFGQLSMVHTGGFTIGFGLGSWLYTHVHSFPLIGLLSSAALLIAVLLICLQSKLTAEGATQEVN